MLLFSQMYGSSIDCPNLRSLAYSMEMNIRQPSIWTELQGDCCTATGIWCGSGRVNGIDWRSLGLTGTINSTAIPSLLEYFIIAHNRVTGDISSFLLPASLINIGLDDNELTGTIPVLPSGLIVLYISINSLNGTIPAILPNELEYLVVSHNKFSGDVNGFSVPASLVNLGLDDNLFTGKVFFNFPIRLEYLYFSSNLLYGGLPAIPSTVTWLGISRNQFTESISLNRPIYIDISDNFITDITVNVTTALTSCDLSRNPLLGNPHISNLTMCGKNGIFAIPTPTTAIVKTTFISSLVSKTSFAVLFDASSSTSLALEMDSTTITAGSITSPFDQYYRVSTKSEMHAVYNNTFINSSAQSYTITTTQSQSLNPVLLIKTSQFSSPYSLIVAALKIMIECVILGIVISKTPFKREIKNFRKSQVQTHSEF